MGFDRLLALLKKLSSEDARAILDDISRPNGPAVASKRCQSQLDHSPDEKESPPLRE
jgi:hypothetical protein